MDLLDVGCEDGRWKKPAEDRGFRYQNLSYLVS